MNRYASMKNNLKQPVIRLLSKYPLRLFVILFYFLLFFGFVSCKKSTQPLPINTKKEDSSWIHEDPKIDSISGISLDKAYRELNLEDAGEKVIVAVMDTQIDIDHEDLRNQIYVNKTEIANNQKDDDNNGFVDDVNGWNFLGYGQYGYERYASFVQVRVLRKFGKKFEGKKLSEISTDNLQDFKLYQYCLEKYNGVNSKEQPYLETDKEVREEFYQFIKLFSDRIPGHDDYTIAQLDTLEIRNENEERLVAQMKKNISYGYTFDYTYRDQENTLIDIYTCNNLNYNERSKIGDDPLDIETVGYGNGNVKAQSHVFHGTQVSGIIAATRNNGIGIRGLSNRIKIMPLTISPEYGHYNDKDLSNAVRYAVDNGAKIINLSGSKEYTENEELLFYALKYAEKNGVLIITSAGNKGKNLDIPENRTYFNDTYGEDSVDNLISVGASTKSLGKGLLAFYSNYGKENVDLFAPGSGIKTTDTRMQQYIENSGTSLSSALTSGVAALIWSHYPQLSHTQVKEVIMSSGTAFDTLRVRTREKDSVLFKDLSKSGKVLNAYSAMKMAKKMASKSK